MSDFIYNFALLGHPVKHSISPNIHNQFLKEHSLIGAYILVDVQTDQLSETVKSLVKLGFRGANVTIPHKTDILSFVDERSDAVLRIAAANTLLFRDGVVYADNTDYIGFLDSLGDGVQPRRALVIGAGGSARAVVYALHRAGVSRVDFLLRDERSAASVQKKDSIIQSMYDLQLCFGVMESGACYDIVVNTSPIGMHNHSEGQSPLGVDQLIAIRESNPQCLVYDLIYNPAQTQLMRDAQAIGLSAQNGSSMLYHQAKRAFDWWVWDGQM